jgi:hypothetical protein
MMKKAASDWWSNNWGYVVAGGVLAIGGVIALNIFTGGAITAALPVIMQILTAVFLAQTIAQVGGYVSSFVSQSWAGNTDGGTKSMNNAIGVGVVELASYLTMKAGSVLAKGGKVAVNAAKSTFKAGVNLAKRGAQIVIKGAKWILEKGKLIFKGLDDAAGRVAKTLRGLGDDILQRVGFKGVKIKVHGRRFEIWGQINPWVLLASGDITEVDEAMKGAVKVSDDELKTLKSLTQEERRVLGDLTNLDVIGKVPTGKTVAGIEDGTKSLSGWTPKKGFVQATDEVMVKAEQIGHDIRNHKLLDQGTPGRYNASHAEKQLSIFTDEPIRVSQKMCSDCQPYFLALAKAENKIRIVADPDAIRVFYPNGEVKLLPANLFKK